jgi:2-polyprenyl-6-methoxyphenol hydroxylase-like FAD-dependent oxidoreductase
MADTSVLIVGAGPTGLVLALWLTRQGVPVRIVDRTAGPGTTSRALAVHARTLELYEQLELADPVVQKGYAVPGARLWLGGEPRAHLPFGQIVSDLTPYGFLHIFPQDEHEKLLIARLEQLGGRVERQTELVSFSEEADHVSARLQRPDGAEETVQAAFIAGCDGPHSRVREGMGAGFPGGTYQQIFYVADVAGEGPAFNGDLNVDLDEADFLAIFPLADKRRIRLIGATRPQDGKDVDKLTFDDVRARAIRSLKLEVDEVNWFSTYHVHHRVADHFRAGRAFLLGDAAHIHTPVGGQGMNTGIGDAINLAWKLAAVLSGQAPDRILDTFEAERRAFALRLVKTTDQAFVFVASEGHFAEMARKRIAPIVLPQVVKLEAVREFVFRTLSQITINYRGKGLDAGRAGPVHGGDRLPWVQLGENNHAPLRRIGWQVHVYGAADDQLMRWCDAQGLPLETFRWVPSMHEAGLRENALYLIRPDTYVAVAAAHQDVAALDRFFEETSVRTPNRVLH